MSADTSGRSACATFLKCCGSTEWARQMAAVEGENLFDAAARIWWSLEPADWLEAFAAHPKIGENSESKWSQQEQAGASGASNEILAELRDANRAYAQKFGYIFIVCATGKTAEEMLALLTQRMDNDPEAELRIAAAEQLRITHLRLEKLLAS
ncbi:MAG: 2-oxo-4-hydroxy-4-carboxy-5-ureidoimidazoline decarboxylase [Acidobacteriota bacterium]|nr:2-oxo-4-hydroxy-4-carboxy-5-ureidoimidazoline decarboxylase [Acidobacteriota bacterium]